MPSVSASWRVTSVLPTPVGPEKRNEEIGRSGFPKPDRANLIALTNALIALS